MTPEQLIAMFVAAHHNKVTAKEAYHKDPSSTNLSAYTLAIVVWDKAWETMFSYGR